MFSARLGIVVAIAVCLLRSAAADASSTFATVGDPTNPSALPQQLADAYSSGARTITIRPGQYMLPAPSLGGDGVLTLKGWSDATIKAYGAKLILTDLQWNHNLWELDNCTNVTIAGGVLSQNEVTAYQGKVVAIGQGTDGKAYADWAPDIGYPIPPAGSTTFPGAINIVDKSTHFLKVGCEDYYGCPMSLTGANTYRIIFNSSSLKFGVGDSIVGRYGNAPFKVHLVSCKNCTIKDVTMMRNGFANIREEGSGGGNHILHCVWALGPTPTGAKVAPLVTNAADGLHSTGANPGPDIENCVFEGVLLDDCIAIHGYFITVISGKNASMVVANKDLNGFSIGEPLRIANSNGFIADVHATAIADNGDNTSTVTIDQSITVPAGSKFSATDRDGPGYKIIGCLIGGTRSRGILAKADNGLIEHNVISNCGMSAVSLGPEYYWGESNYVHNVTVQDNTFDDDGIFGSGGPCVWVHGEGAVGNQNIIIQGNRFDHDLEVNVEIDWSRDVTIANNTFHGEDPWPGAVPVVDLIDLANSHDIIFNANKVYNASVFNPTLVNTKGSVTGIQNNDSTGINVVDGG